MTFTFTLSTESVNSYGFITKTDGINLSTFTQNPVMLFDHNTSLVIGKWVNIRKEGTQLIADAEFDEKDPFAQQIKSKVAQGFLKSASIGYHCNWDTLQQTDKGQAPVIMDSTLLEASIVALPSNREAQVHLSQDQKKQFQMYQEQHRLSEQGKQNEALIAEVAHLKATIKKLEEAYAQRIEQEKQNLLKEAIASRKITEAEADILRDLPVEKLSLLLSERQTPPTLMSQIKEGGEHTLSFAVLSKTDPQRLAQIKKDNPALYQSLYQKEYGTPF